MYFDEMKNVTYLNVIAFMNIPRQLIMYAVNSSWN